MKSKKIKYTEPIPPQKWIEKFALQPLNRVALTMEQIKQIQDEAYTAGQTKASEVVALRGFFSEEGHASAQAIIAERDSAAMP